MTKGDKETIKEMLTNVLNVHTESVNGKFNVIHSELLHIKAQTEKTNGRVNTMEAEIGTLKINDVTHVSNCPNSKKINELEKNEFSRKAIIRFIIISSGITATIVGIIISILDFYINQ